MGCIKNEWLIYWFSKMFLSFIESMIEWEEHSRLVSQTIMRFMSSCGVLLKFCLRCFHLCINWMSYFCWRCQNKQLRWKKKKEQPLNKWVDENTSLHLKVVKDRREKLLDLHILINLMIALSLKENHWICKLNHIKQVMLVLLAYTSCTHMRVQWARTWFQLLVDI